MKAKRTIHVLTDKKGAIVGRGILTSAKDRKGKAVHTQITPMKGQTLTEVLMPAEIKQLEGTELFRRLLADFRLSPGKKELLCKPGRR